MLPLRELQLRFAAALFDGAVEPIAPFIRDGGIDAAARLRIYRNNLREGFTKTLALEFPVIERLVGEGYFRQLALDFLAAHPCRAGNLHHLGAPFPPFLRQRFENTEYAYLADVAALEWAYQESMIAADTQPLDPETLRNIDPAQCAELHFDLHPACRLVKSPYPIVRIWSTNQPDATSDEIIDLRGDGDHVLVRRAADCIDFDRLPAGSFALLEALNRGLDLGAALETAQAADAAFNLGEALRRFIARGVLANAHLVSANSPFEGD